MKIHVVKFAEHLNNKKDKYCVDTFGNKYTLTESKLQELWWGWLLHNGVKRNDTKEYTVFEVLKGYLYLEL